MRYITKFGVLLIEHHGISCTCSYCGDRYSKSSHYGLNIPKAWNKFNSWYIIKFGVGKYFRWTNRWFLFFKRKIK